MRLSIILMMILLMGRFLTMSASFLNGITYNAWSTGTLLYWIENSNKAFQTHLIQEFSFEDNTVGVRDRIAAVSLANVDACLLACCSSCDSIINPFEFLASSRGYF